MQLNFSRLRLFGNVRRALLAAASALFVPALWAATITVNATGDTTANDGVCTLREAITAANTDAVSGAAAGECAAGAGSDVIVFSIAGAGVKLITPTVALPIISTPIRINGYSQPGSSANTNGASLGSNASILIEIDNGAVANAATLEVNGAIASGSIIEGIAFSRSANSGCCANIGIVINGSASVWIRGNFFGTGVDGKIAKTLSDRGVYISGTTADTIIGSDATALLPAYKNVFSATATAVTTTAPVGLKTTVTIRGNLIGTEVSGNAVVTGGSMGTGLFLDQLTGASLVSDNVISGTSSVGVSVRSTDGLVIERNLIGVGVNGTTALGNGSNGGILVEDNPFSVGSGVTGLTIRSNVIANNAGPGVTVRRQNAANTVQGVAISKNVIRNNVGMEIDLYNGNTSDGVTDNDNAALDTDTGANNLQNFPDITAATSNGSSIQAQYNFNSEPNKSFTLEFFQVASCDATKTGGADVFLASLGITTNAAGSATGTALLSTALTTGSITATATNTMNGTSEFSACADIVAPVTALLTIIPSGGGNGVVTGTGINCGADCTESFLQGSVVTLTATPAGGSTFFPGWSGGGCSGTGTCAVTMSAAQTVNAQFSLVAPVGQIGPATPVPALDAALLVAMALLVALVVAWVTHRPSRW